jgi:pyruvate/2-oxoacid:ferredoxin oxidoreductase beta subunit
MTLQQNHNSAPESGHLGCPGCGEALGLRLVLEVIGSNAIMVVPACCASYVDGIWPSSAARIPILHVAMETTAAVAAGIRAALEVKGLNDTHVLAWAGGSGAFDSGLHAISSAAERNEDILYICYNNESYVDMDIHYYADGGSRRGRRTYTDRRHQRIQKNIIEIMAAHHVPYCATACVAYPDDLASKVKKALSIPGFRFMHLLSPCPTHWEIPSELSVELTRAAVQTRIFPLYEVEDGTKYTINILPESFAPVSKFLSRQGRFVSLSAEAIRQVQNRVESRWRQLQRKVELSHGGATGQTKIKTEKPTTP